MQRMQKYESAVRQNGDTTSPMDMVCRCVEKMLTQRFFFPFSLSLTLDPDSYDCANHQFRICHSLRRFVWLIAVRISMALLVFMQQQPIRFSAPRQQNTANPKLFRNFTAAKVESNVLKIRIENDEKDNCRHRWSNYLMYERRPTSMWHIVLSFPIKWNRSNPWFVATTRHKNRKISFFTEDLNLV